MNKLRYKDIFNCELRLKASTCKAYWRKLAKLSPVKTWPPPQPPPFPPDLSKQPPTILEQPPIIIILFQIIMPPSKTSSHLTHSLLSKTSTTYSPPNHRHLRRLSSTASKGPAPSSPVPVKPPFFGPTTFDSRT